MRLWKTAKARGRATLKGPDKARWHREVAPPSPPHKYLATAPRSAAAKAGDKFTVRDFRADCLRELKKTQCRVAGPACRVVDALRGFTGHAQSQSGVVELSSAKARTRPASEVNVMLAPLPITSPIAGAGLVAGVSSDSGSSIEPPTMNSANPITPTPKALPRDPCAKRNGLIRPSTDHPMIANPTRIKTPAAISDIHLSRNARRLSYPASGFWPRHLAASTHHGFILPCSSDQTTASRTLGGGLQSGTALLINPHRDRVRAEQIRPRTSLHPGRPSRHSA